ncbi:SDR family oxidoreductase [Haloferula sargassicola]|uniref:3-oxoacyl-[acyl-carrier-protein] reductase FabG n=1 Tax=Haloferula sargassicola TaxID=490096 RepID=A0ABP9UNS9_9BACT
MQHILITGATRGLGRALALGFAEKQLTVSACGTSPEALASLATEIGEPHLIRACDVTDPARVADFAAAVLDRHGPPDLLINNAAIITPNAPLWETSEADFSRIVDVNLKGVHHVLRAFLPAMIDRGHGIIVNLSSGWGRSTAPEVAPYCCTKWGIEGLTRALAQELPPGLAAIPLNPGIIDTDMLRSCFGGDASAHRSAADWAATAIPFLLSLTPAQSGQPLTAP